MDQPSGIGSTSCCDSVKDKSVDFRIQKSDFHKYKSQNNFQAQDCFGPR